MKPKEVFIPVPADLRMPIESKWYMIKVKGLPHYIHAWYVIVVNAFDDEKQDNRYFKNEVEHWLEKKEGYFLTKEELEKVFQHGAYIHPVCHKKESESNFVSNAFNRWLKTQNL
jgi:hypothetical protein